MATPIQIFSITTALLSSGSILSLTLFDIPTLQSQPGSRSLPSLRWLFSRGSHIFPSAAIITSSGFAYLAYTALPPASRTLSQLTKGGPASFYAAAAAFTLSIAPWTGLVMIPTNFALIQKNEEKGGARSAKSARESTASKGRTAEDSVGGKDDVNQYTDLSGPQERTTDDTSRKEDEEVKALLEKFGRMNAVRGVLMGVGGVLGLVGALM